MKPKPFSLLNHFTVPLAMICSFVGRVDEFRRIPVPGLPNEPSHIGPRPGNEKTPCGSQTPRASRKRTWNCKTATGENGSTQCRGNYRQLGPRVVPLVIGAGIGYRQTSKSIGSVEFHACGGWVSMTEGEAGCTVAVIGA